MKLNLNKQGFTLFELIVAMAIIVVLVILVSIGVGSCSHRTDDGNRIGTIVKFSQPNTFNDTWEGVMQIGGNNTMQIENWQFSVNDPAVAAEVKSAMATGKRVYVEYVHVRWTPPWASKTGYRLKSVKVIQ